MYSYILKQILTATSTHFVYIKRFNDRIKRRVQIVEKINHLNENTKTYNLVKTHDYIKLYVSRHVQWYHGGSDLYGCALSR